MNNKDDKVHISSDEDDASSNAWLQTGNCQLKEDEKAILASKDMWLNDLIINAAQYLMAKQFPHIGGFQDTVLQSNLSFTVQNGEFVQILNKGSNHWITVKNNGLGDMSSIRILTVLLAKDLIMKYRRKSPRYSIPTFH